MTRKRKPLEFDDPYDEGVSGKTGGGSWGNVGYNAPTRKGREAEWDDFFKAVADEGKCPSCGSISRDYLMSSLCSECGYEG